MNCSYYSYIAINYDYVGITRTCTISLCLHTIGLLYKEILDYNK